MQEEARPDHFAAFVESTVEGIDTETVMRLHGMSRDNIYQIRTRFTAKLKTFVETIRTEMDEGRFGFAKPSARVAIDPPDGQRIRCGGLRRFMV